MIDASSSLVDVCFLVCTALERAGTTAVLTGGSAATFYAPAAYQSLDAELLHVLTRTDSVRDRLASFYYWNDRSALDAALAVARSGPFDMTAVAAWSEREGETTAFAEFASLLGEREG